MTDPDLEIRSDKFDRNSRVIVTDPGAVPYVDLQPESFSQIISSNKKLADRSDWIVQTPVGF